jgi:hypothetical protein
MLQIRMNKTCAYKYGLEVRTGQYAEKIPQKGNSLAFDKPMIQTLPQLTILSLRVPSKVRGEAIIS